MRFPHNVLASNERVVRHLHPHWLTVLGPVVVAVVLVALAAATARWTPDDEAGNRIQWIALAVMVLVAVPLVVVPLLRWRTTHYVVTSHRVMVRRGVLAKAGKDITLSKITDVSFRQGFLERLLGSGTLTVESAGDAPDELLRDIPHSDEVQQLLNRLIDEDANRRAGRIVERMEHERWQRPVLAEEQGPGEGGSPTPPPG